MSRKSTIVRHTAEELAAMRRRGRSRSDWARAGSVGRKQLERSIAADPEEAGMAIDWKNATLELPGPKAILNMRVDRRVLEYFRRSGRGYQTRINAVLRAFVDAQEHRSR
jgi:uncharacterized protein (DUF4415 family)